MATENGTPPAGTGSVLLDHGSSERRLHRALYVLRYLRAVSLNITLVAAAVALSGAFGLSGLYPVADNILSALDAQLDPQLVGALPGWLVPTTIAVMVLLMTGFFVWTFFSIVRLWRWALRFQAAIAVAIAVFWTYNDSMLRTLGFGLRAMDPLFAGLAVLASVVVFVVAMDIAFALGAASFARDDASFRAAFDRRLIRSRWTALNRFLDFPRTPLRSWRVGLAWGLDAAAALILVASVVYLLSVGSVQNKLSTLEGVCGVDRIAACRAQSRAEALEIIAWMGIALIGLKGAGLLQSLSRMLGAVGVDRALDRPEAAFLLYLRPFDADDVALPKPRLPFLSAVFAFRPFPARVEEELFDVSDGFLPLIAVGKPGSRAQGRSAHRAFLDDADWRDFVRDKIRRAAGVAILLKDTEGVRWELSTLLAEGAATRTLFLFDPAARDEAVWRRLAGEALDALRGAGLVAPDFRFRSRALGFWLTEDGVVEIRNPGWSATSYRTAFSEFLGARLADRMRERS